MKVEILYVPGCPNHQRAIARVQEVLASESPHAELTEVPVNSALQAACLNFPGSPTIRVDGQDVEPDEAGAIGLSCRLYRNQNGVPSEETLRSAIRRAMMRRSA